MLPPAPAAPREFCSPDRAGMALTQPLAEPRAGLSHWGPAACQQRAQSSCRTAGAERQRSSSSRVGAPAQCQALDGSARGCSPPGALGSGQPLPRGSRAALPMGLCKPAQGTLPNPCPARIRLTRQIRGALSSPGAARRLCHPPASPYLSAGCTRTPLQHGFLPRGRKFSHSNWPKRYRGEDVIRVEQALKPEDRSNYREPIPLQQSQPQGNAGRIFQRGLRATEAAYPLCPQEK